MLCPRGSEASSLARRNKPPVGFEPKTSRLLSGCSAHQAKEAMEKGALDRVLKNHSVGTNQPAARTPEPSDPLVGRILLRLNAMHPTVPPQMGST